MPAHSPLSIQYAALPYRVVDGKVEVLLEGTSDESDLLLQGRMETQAPDIDAAVFLTECDPSSFMPGDFAAVEIVGARDYDLLARPVI